MNSQTKDLAAIGKAVVNLKPTSIQGWSELGMKIRLYGTKTDHDHIILYCSKFLAQFRMDIAVTNLIEGVEVTSTGWVMGDAAGVMKDGVPVISSAQIHLDEVHLFGLVRRSPGPSESGV